MRELERYKDALEKSIHLFGLLRHAADSQNSADLADAGILAVERALRPAPEMEDVPLERWAVVAPSGYVQGTYASEDAAIDQTTSRHGAYFGYRVAKLTGTYASQEAAGGEERQRSGDDGHARQSRQSQRYRG